MYPIHIMGIIFILLHIILEAIRDSRRNKFKYRSRGERES